MRLLLYLAARAGEVVSIDELLSEVWSGVIVTSDSVYQAVASLRRVLGDDPKQPAYIATVPRRGYRMVAEVSAPASEPVVSPEFFPAPRGDPPTGPLRRTRVLVAVAAALSLAVVASYMLRNQFATTHPSRASASVLPPRNSIAVVPFIDLTAGMSHEYFADGVTEEVIDKLSKVPSLHVAPPTSSFYLKRKQIAIGEIARTLGVAYVLDGSVRKSGATLRVAARLSRGDDGYVVWSQTYDRTLGDLLKVQDDIGVEVATALKACIDSYRPL
jgi:transcriptional activator of cad operon